MDKYQRLSFKQRSSNLTVIKLFKYFLSYDNASGSEITLCIKIDNRMCFELSVHKPLVVYRFLGTCNIMKLCP